MSLRAKFFRGGVDLAFGYVAQQGLLFLRNVLIARLLGPEDFGVTVTFAILISVVEMMSDLGVEQFIVQSPDGNSPRFQSALQGFVIARGLVLGAMIFAFAGHFAVLFDTPEAEWIYRWLALVPILKGVMHLDLRRYHREMRYRPALVVQLVSVAIGLVTAVALGLMLRSYEALFWAHLLQATASAVGSHLAAERPYRVVFDLPSTRRLLVFGWPLLLNGLVLLAMGQGDRIVLGSLLGVVDLANYAAIATVTGGASLLVMKLTGSLYVPLLAAAQADPSAFARRYQICGAITAIASFGILVPLVMIGPALISFIYGPQYDISPFVVGWLAVLAAAMVLRSWSIAAALATAQTRDILYANCFRLVGLPLAALAVLHGYGAPGVAFLMAAGELLAAAFSLIRADFYALRLSRLGTSIFALFVGLSAISLGGHYLGHYTGHVMGAVLFSGIPLMVTIAAVFWLTPAFRVVFRSSLQQFASAYPLVKVQ